MKQENTAKVTGRDLPVSTKHVIEISKFIRNKNLQKAKTILDQVINKKTAVPFKRFNKNVGHKPGKIAAGRYPIKASKEVLTLLNSLEANAQNKGLDTASLVLTEIIPNKSSRPWHYGRQRRRKMKRTHLKIIAKEISKPKEEKPAEKKIEKQPKKEKK